MRGLMFIVLLTLVLSSCLPANTLKGIPLEQVNTTLETTPAPTPTIKDACAAITCSNNQVCINGACVCPSETKKCVEQCIPQNGCCTSSDCKAGEQCITNACVFNCEALTCATGMTCDPKAQRCTCPKDYKWCEYQQKCIPQDHCCSRFDCRSGERCVDTIASAELCLKLEGTSCKIFNTLGKKILTVSNKNFEVNLLSITFLDSIKATVNGQELALKQGERKKIGEADFYISKLRELGGECRDFSRTSSQQQ